MLVLTFLSYPKTFYLLRFLASRIAVNVDRIPPFSMKFCHKYATRRRQRAGAEVTFLLFLVRCSTATKNGQLFGCYPDKLHRPQKPGRQQGRVGLEVAVGIQSEAGEHLYVVGVAVVVVAGVARRLGEDRRLDAFKHPNIAVDAVAFDLMRCRGGPPEKSFWDTFTEGLPCSTACAEEAANKLAAALENKKRRRVRPQSL